MTEILQLPPAQTPVLDGKGYMTQPWRNFFSALVSRAGGIIGGWQTADPVLDSLSGLNATPGLLILSAADTITKRTLVGVAGRTVVSNGNGAVGNPTVDLAPVAGVSGVHASPTSVTVDGYGRITAISP